MRSLTIALSKGRILKQTLPLLDAAGLRFDEDIVTSRRLIHHSIDGRISVMVVRTSDAPTFVRHGVADLGIVGRDVILEQGADGLQEQLDLGIGRCRLIVAAPEGKIQGGYPRRFRVASKYVNTTRRHFAACGVQAEVIKLGGAIELAPLSGLADAIVDLTETGSSLRANQLEEIEEIAQISSRLVANPIASKTRRSEIQPLIEAFAAAIATEA
ncbi:ATP phosphoribosyltransferase [Gammaproteobacteria bacterium]|nr:ATP phosphoribosyltransferase [Gammaproteobacteria bacterium]